MSDELVIWAARQRCGSPAAKAVLTALSDISRHATGPIAWPSVATIAEHAEVNPKTVVVALRQLVERKLIVDTGRRHGRTGQVIEWMIGPERLPELGGLGDHAAQAKTPENGSLTPAKTPVFSSKDPQKRVTTLSQDSKKEARGDASAREPVSKSARREELLGEGGLNGLSPSLPGSDPPPVIVGASFDHWDAMERSHGLPGPVKRSVPRERALIAKLRAVGSDGVAAVIAAAGWDHVRPKRRAANGQADWLTMFDRVFEVGPEYRGLKLFDRLLALPGRLLDDDADDPGGPPLEVDQIPAESVTGP